MSKDPVEQLDRSSLLPDTALNDPKLDRLDRAQFASALSRSILGLSGDDSFVIGLCGPWGSGKTSILNFVVSEFDSAKTDHPVVLRFNPWWFSGRDQLLEAFLAQFAAALQAPQRGDKAKKVASLLSTLSAGLRPLAFLPFVGEAVKTGRDAIDALAGAANAYADAVHKDVVGIRSELDHLLKEFGQRIVVVMDDIDRLPASEIAQLFLILKAVADFPKTIYLLAFDQQVVLKAITDQLGVDGKTYLEKIVQLQLDVPPTGRPALHQMFIEQLNELLQGEVLVPEDERYFWNVFHDGVKPFLVTPRSVKKLINMLRFAYPPLRGEVNVVDMVGVACLATFAPQVIGTVASHSEQFVGVGPRSAFGGNDDRKEREAFHRRWLDELPEGDKGPVEGIVRRLFPSVDNALGGPAHSPEFETTWRQQLRVCSGPHFEKYLRLAIVDGTVSESDWNALRKLFDDDKALDESLLHFAKLKGSRGVQSQAGDLLDRALLFAKTADEQSARTLFRSLMRMGDLLCQVRDEVTVEGMLSLDNCQRMTWLLHELLERCERKKDREVRVLESLSQSTGLLMATELVVSLGYQNGAYGDGKGSTDPRYPPIVRKSFIGKSAKVVRELLKTGTAGERGGELASHPMFMRIVVNWWTIGGKKEARDWLRTVAADDRLLVSLLLQQVSKLRSHGMGDRVAMETPIIDTKFLKKLLPLKELRGRCEALLRDKPEWLDERSALALRITADSVSPNGKPIDHWGQRLRQRSPKKRARKSKDGANKAGT